MVLSKGLIISLGFSALSCTLLFLYFRNKMTTVERKVNVMFDLVQNYQPTQEYSSQPNQSYEPVNEDTQHHQDNQNNENTGAWNLNAEDNRIVISDDSDDDDDDDDSDEVSDSDSDDESEEIPKLSLAKTDNISLTENDIKKISVKETPVIDDTIELEEVDSLDEINDDDDDDDDYDNNNSEIEISNTNVKKISVTKNDTEENIDNNEDDNNEDDNEESQDNDEVAEDNDEVDYTQLKVSELKSIAEAKGLTNYKSLKKTPLIDLIKSAE